VVQKPGAKTMVVIHGSGFKNSGAVPGPGVTSQDRLPAGEIQKSRCPELGVVLLTRTHGSEK
jgi:hypothetical protein